MMLRGCQKKIIVLKNTNSGIFDEAYFILKEGAARQAAFNESDMIGEANRIITENMLTAPQHPGGSGRSDNRGRGRLIRWYIAGAASCGAAVAVVMALLYYLPNAA